MTCMQIAARYLVISLAQTALGRIAQRWVASTRAAIGTGTAGIAAKTKAKEEVGNEVYYSKQLFFEYIYSHDFND